MKMTMKTLTLSVLLAFSASSFAEILGEDVEQAQTLYALRGEDKANALAAADLYAKIAANAENAVDKATMLNAESQAIYYVGTQVKEDKDKKVYFQRGMDAADAGIKLLVDNEATMDDATKNVYAISYYQYGANLGKWAEANGVASSLGRWPELERNMKKVMSLKQEAVVSFGAYRILGRAYYKLPAPIGSNKKAETFLKKAFDETKNGGDISNHGLNVLFYADLLIATDRKDDAKVILESFVAKDATTLNPARIPETKQEQVEALEKLKDL